MKSQKIWNISTGSEHFARLQSMQVDLLDNRFYDLLVAETWQPIKVYLENKDRPLGDIIRLTLDVFVFNNRARHVLSDLINDSVEYLRLNYEPEPLYIVNVTDYIRCVDMNKSNFETPYLGIEIQANGLIFEKDCLQDKHIFKLPRLTQIYVSDKFKQVVEEHELKGAEFHSVSAFEK